jgi:hypothetical protein
MTRLLLAASVLVLAVVGYYTIEYFKPYRKKGR